MDTHDWNEFDLQMMRLALTAASACEESHDVPVGAVICRDMEILVTERNRKEELRDATAHAECLAIRQACDKLNSPYLEDCTLYVTLEPCIMCAGAIIHARVGRVIYAAADPKTGALGSLCNVVDLNLNHRPEVLAGLLGEEASAMLKDFFRRRRAENKRIGGRGQRKRLILNTVDQDKGGRDE